MRFDVDVRARVGETEVACTFVAEDGLTVLFGPSGAGKTSVLNMIAGLIRPRSGHVRAGERTLFDAGAGADVPPERRRIGYVFQDARLFPHKRVRANLLYGKSPSPSGEGLGWGLSTGDIAHGTAPPPAPPLKGRGEDAVDYMIDFLGIAHLLDRWPKTLSGGEARRVAIGRALLSDPDILLLDEPLSSLDAARRGEIEAVIVRLRDTVRLPIVLVTHDAGEAERMGTRVVAMR